MGRLIDFEARRGRSSPARAPAWRPAEAVEFAFDLADPWTYMAAERVDRMFDRVRWTPASAPRLSRRPDPAASGAERRRAQARADSLRLPLQWPDRYPAEVPAAMRAAHHACQDGHGGAFVLAAGRLAFCGGFDLDDPEVLAEAAAAASVCLDATLSAARDCARDAEIDAAGRGLLAAGADALPVLRVGRTLLCGEARISALGATRAQLAAL